MYVQICRVYVLMCALSVLTRAQTGGVLASAATILSEQVAVCVCVCVRVRVSVCLCL